MDPSGHSTLPSSLPEPSQDKLTPEAMAIAKKVTAERFALHPRS